MALISFFDLNYLQYFKMLHYANKKNVNNNNNNNNNDSNNNNNDNTSNNNNNNNNNKNNNNDKNDNNNNNIKSFSCNWVHLQVLVIKKLRRFSELYIGSR